MNWRRFPRKLVGILARRVGLPGLGPALKSVVSQGDQYDHVPKGQYDYVPKGTYVFGPADRFLLVPKNRYRITLKPGLSPSAELGVGWLTETNTPEAYDQLWADDGNVSIYKTEGGGVRARMPAEIVDAVGAAVDRARTVIDVGCGIGDLLDAVRSRNAQARLHGCDFSESAVARARQRFSSAEIKCFYINDRLPYADDNFDLVLCTDVLEHLEDARSVVNDLVRICAPGGTLAIVVPDGDVDNFIGHVWFWNEQSLAKFLGDLSPLVFRLPDCREFMAIIKKPGAPAD